MPAMAARPKPIPADLERLLERAREVRWNYPSSAGNPGLVSGIDAAEEWDASRDSFHEAARFLIENAADEAAVELAANVWRLWMQARDIAGGRAFLALVLDGGSRTPTRARALALYGDGLFAFWQGAREESRERNEEALEVARTVGDAEALALAHLGLSRVLLDDGEIERARSHAIQAREFARELEPSLGQAPLHLEAQAKRLAGSYDRAAALFEESLALNRRLGDEGMVAVELHNLGHVEIHRGNIDAAESYFAECARLGSDDDPYGQAMTSLNQAAIAFGRQDHDRARELLASAEPLLRDSGTEPAADDRFEIDWLRARLAEA
jgi:tetratricopeptide (TPR) repeat protein